MTEATLAGGSARRTVVAGRPRRRHANNRAGWLFLTPFLVLFAGFVITPALMGLWISLHRWNPVLPRKPFIGLDNYKELFTPGSLTFGDFWQSMGATGLFTVLSVPFLVVIPLILAVLLNRRLPGIGVLRAIFFAPYVLGAAVIALMWRYLLDPQNGAVNGLLAMLGVTTQIPWTVDSPWVWITLVAVTVWWTSGFNMVIYLAGLKGIDKELYDAAAVDGASSMHTFFAVTLPGLRPVMAFVTTMTILNSANMFGQSYLLTVGHPGTSTRTVVMYIANYGLSGGQMGAASAMSYVLFAFLAIISIINYRLQTRESRP